MGPATIYRSVVEVEPTYAASLKDDADDYMQSFGIIVLLDFIMLDCT